MKNVIRMEKAYTNNISATFRPLKLILHAWAAAMATEASRRRTTSCGTSCLSTYMRQLQNIFHEHWRHKDTSSRRPEHGALWGF